MARKKTRRRSRSFTIPVALTVPLVPPAIKAYQIFKETNSVYSALVNYQAYYTGWTGNPARAWNPEYLKYGAAPLALGFLVHKLAGKLGINRMLASGNVPVVRV